MTDKGSIGTALAAGAAGSAALVAILWAAGHDPMTAVPQQPVAAVTSTADPATVSAHLADLAGQLEQVRRRLPALLDQVGRLSRSGPQLTLPPLALPPPVALPPAPAAAPARAAAAAPPAHARTGASGAKR